MPQTLGADGPASSLGSWERAVTPGRKASWTGLRKGCPQLGRVRGTPEGTWLGKWAPGRGEDTRCPRVGTA